MSRRRVRRPVVRIPDPVPSAPPAAAGNEYRFVFALLLIAGLAVAFGVARAQRRSTAMASPRPVSSVDPSPSVRAEDLVVETRIVALPDEILPARDWAVPVRWRLPGYTRERALTLLADVAGAAPRLDCDASGCSLLPPLESVAALSPPVRSRIYSVLALIDGNPQAGDTFYRSDPLGPFSAVPGIPPAVRPLMDSLTWHREGVPAFSDLAVVCGRLGTREACRGFMRAMLSRPSAAVSLRLRDPEVIERVVSSFVPSEQAAVRDRLTAARAAGEATLPLDALLPSWARSRLGTFPAADEAWTNCFWTVLRFVDRASGAVADGEALDAVLRRDFEQVPSAARFGDVLVVRDAEQRPLHSATWLLGGYLFEKNGFGRLQAWRIVPLSDVMMEYPTAGSVNLWRLRPRG